MGFAEQHQVHYLPGQYCSSHSKFARGNEPVPLKLQYTL